MLETNENNFLSSREANTQIDFELEPNNKQIGLMISILMETYSIQLFTCRE